MIPSGTPIRPPEITMSLVTSRSWSATHRYARHRDPGSSDAPRPRGIPACPPRPDGNGFLGGEILRSRKMQPRMLVCRSGPGQVRGSAGDPDPGRDPPRTASDDPADGGSEKAGRRRWSRTGISLNLPLSDQIISLIGQLGRPPQKTSGWLSWNRSPPAGLRPHLTPATGGRDRSAHRSRCRGGVGTAGPPAPPGSPPPAPCPAPPPTGRRS